MQAADIFVEVSWRAETKMTFSSLAAMKVVKITTFSAHNDDNFIQIAIFYILVTNLHVIINDSQHEFKQAQPPANQKSC